MSSKTGKLPIMLKDILDWPKILAAPRYAGGHLEVLRVLFKPAEVIAESRDNDYQGAVAMAYRLPGGWIVALTDGFGSCSGCDSWKDCSDERARALCVALANNARAWPSLGEATAWIEKNANTKDNYLDAKMADLLPQLRKLA